MIKTTTKNLSLLLTMLVANANTILGQSHTPSSQAFLSLQEGVGISVQYERTAPLHDDIRKSAVWGYFANARFATLQSSMRLGLGLHTNQSPVNFSTALYGFGGAHNPRADGTGYDNSIFGIGLVVGTEFMFNENVGLVGNIGGEMANSQQRLNATAGLNISF